MPKIPYELQEKTCCICGKTFTGWGNNPEPVMPYANETTRLVNRCCDDCNMSVVIPARIAHLRK